jgi:hypothetical protein
MPASSSVRSSLRSRQAGSNTRKRIPANVRGDGGNRKRFVLTALLACMTSPGPTRRRRIPPRVSNHARHAQRGGSALAVGPQRLYAEAWSPAPSGLGVAVGGRQDGHLPPTAKTRPAIGGVRHAWRPEQRRKDPPHRRRTPEDTEKAAGPPEQPSANRGAPS